MLRKMKFQKITVLGLVFSLSTTLVLPAYAKNNDSLQTSHSEEYYESKQNEILTRAHEKLEEVRAELRGAKRSKSGYFIVQTSGLIASLTSFYLLAKEGMYLFKQARSSNIVRRGNLISYTAALIISLFAYDRASKGVALTKAEMDQLEEEVRYLEGQLDMLEMIQASFRQSQEDAQDHLHHKSIELSDGVLNRK